MAGTNLHLLLGQPNALTQRAAHFLRRELHDCKAQMAKSMKTPKFSTRLRRRCQLSGRARGVYRKFRISRIVLRKLALEGKIPGMRKASW